MVAAIDIDDGIYLGNVDKGVIVITENSIYEITVVDKLDRMVMIKGGRILPEPKLCRLHGSTFGGSMIKLGWIGIGMCLEFSIPELNVVWRTSLIEQILPAAH